MSNRLTGFFCCKPNRQKGLSQTIISIQLTNFHQSLYFCPGSRIANRRNRFFEINFDNHICQEEKFTIKFEAVSIAYDCTIFFILLINKRWKQNENLGVPLLINEDFRRNGLLAAKIRCHESGVPEMHQLFIIWVVKNLKTLFKIKIFTTQIFEVWIVTTRHLVVQNPIEFNGN